MNYPCSSFQLHSRVWLFLIPWLKHTRLPCASPIHRAFTELAQTHFHRVGDAIQPSHPLSSPCPPAFNLSQHQSLFQWGSSLHQVAKVLEVQLQLNIHWKDCEYSVNEYSELIYFRTDWLELLAVSRVFSTNTVQRHQFFSTQLFL